MLKMSTETGEDQKSSIPDIVRIFLVKKGVARAGNRTGRHKDFQSSALPTELPSRLLSIKGQTRTFHGRGLKNLAQGLFSAD